MVRWAALSLLPPKALPPQGQAGSWVPQDYRLHCLLARAPSTPRGKVALQELGLPGQGECVGSLKEQTHGLRDVQAGPGGSLAVGSQSQVCPGSLEQDGLCRLWGRGQRLSSPHQTQTEEAGPGWCKRAETNCQVPGWYKPSAMATSH